ncbi:MAG: S-adenosylmethionine decarboxylase [Stackebrandtia sp.]
MISEQIRELLVEITQRGELRDVSPDAPLLHDPVGLDSLGGMRLLRAVKERYGVDVAAEDLNLDALSSLEALVAFVTERVDDVEGEYARLRKLEAYTPKKLYLVDATFGDSPVLGDVAALTSLARDAVTAAGGHVMKDSHVVFPNGAVTLVMILAESHLSIHTWPEERLVAIDLFSCGAIEGRIVIDRLAGGLGLGDVPVREIDRG